MFVEIEKMMTDTELKELVAGLAIAHEKTERDLDSLIAQNEIAHAKREKELDSLIAVSYTHLTLPTIYSV